MPLWPAWFPEDCPPKEAYAAEGEVYRLVESVPATPKDFLPGARREDLRSYGVYTCMNCGVSFFRTTADAQYGRQRLGPWRKALSVAAGTLVNSDGVMLATPSKPHPSHLTVWTEVNWDPVDRFRVVD